MLIAIYLIIIAMFALVATAFYAKSYLKLSPELKREIEGEVWLRENIIKKPLLITRPFAPLSRFILSKVGSHGLRDKFNFVELSILPEDFWGIKFLIILGTLLVVYLIMNKIELLWVGVIIAAGLILPNLYLNRLVQKRRKLIIRAFPEAVDLLNLCVGGGLDLMMGLNWVIKRSRANPLIKEFAWVLHEVKMGKSRHDALKSMAKRVNIPDVFSFINTLVHADRMGTPISEVLTVLSEEARRKRFQRGERAALQAPIKMLFPLIFFILPVVAIIVGGPVLLQFASKGFGKF